MRRASQPHRSGAVFGRYVLVEAIARAPGRSNQQLWLAIDVDLDRKVALELPIFIGDSERARLQAKLATIARLAHPNVAAIHDTGEFEGQLFIAREYVEGEGLDRWLARGPYPWQEAFFVLRQVGAGLCAAHEVGLVHPRLEPSKIILGRDGRVRLLDFGLSALANSGVEREPEPPANEGLELEQETDGRVLRARPRREFGSGPQLRRSPAYLAPEQLRGEAIDGRTNVFGVCALLFEALYGVRPFAGATHAALLRAIEAGEITPIPAQERAPSWIHRVLARGLASEAGARFADMAELLASLERSPSQRRKRRTGFAALGLVGLASIVLALGLRHTREDPCATARAPVAALWGSASREGLAAGLAAHAKLDLDAGEALLAGIDAGAQAWGDASEQLCREQGVERSTPRLWEAGVRCLELHRVAFVALAELAEPDAEPRMLAALGRRPHAALRSLGDPRSCRDYVRAVDGGEASSDAHDRVFARARLIFALRPAGAGELARATLEALDAPDTPDAPAASDAPGPAELELLRGRAAALLGERELARAQLDHAAQLALVSDPVLAAQAWSALAQLELDLLGSREPGVDAGPRAAASIMAWLDYAGAMVELEDLELQTQLALQRVALALALREPAGVAVILERALGLAEAEAETSPDLLAALLEAQTQLHELERDMGAEARDEAERVRGE